MGFCTLEQESVAPIYVKT